MEIVKAKYKSEDNNWIELTFSDGTVRQVSTNDGIRRQYTDMFNEWIANGGVIEPQYTDEELAKREQDKINSEAKAYLASTDWYVVRQQETKKAIPTEILDKREQARAAIK